MKKILLLSIASMVTAFGFAQTAVNFNCNDCASVNHDLFTELNAGKVICITWVMPCTACIGVASSVANTVQGYASSNPGRVKFYLTDDFANTTCATLDAWANNNSIAYDAEFSDVSVSMTDYGNTAMQKTVILGGPNHTVFYNQGGAVSVSAMQTAINNALAATGVIELKNDLSSLKLFPNPVANSASITYSLGSATDVKIQVVNSLGQQVQTIADAKQNAGDHQFNIDCAKLTNGIYFVKLDAGKESKAIKFSVAH